MPSDISSADLATAINVLRRHTSLDVVSKFLKDKSTFLNDKTLYSSAGSWQEIQEKRIQPALDEGKLHRSDIVSLIRDAEEYGRQHVFLYQYDKKSAGELLDEGVLSARLKKMNIADVKDKPKIVDLSKGLQLVDIRIDSFKNTRSLVMKAVDTRAYRKLIDKRINGTQEILTYDLQYDRAVNVISLRADGLMEIRIQSHHNTLDYRKEVDDMVAKATGVLEPYRFGPMSLAKARLYLLNNRKKLVKVLRFCDNQVRDKEGNVMSLASGSRLQNLFEDGGPSDRGLAAFMSVGRPICDEVDCIWLKLSDNSGPSTDIHTLIEGANNEFILTAQCDRANYAYVLEKITSFA